MSNTSLGTVPEEYDCVQVSTFTSSKASWKEVMPADRSLVFNKPMCPDLLSKAS